MRPLGIPKFPERGTLSESDDQEGFIFLVLNRAGIISRPRAEGSLSTSWPWIISNTVHTSLTLAVDSSPQNLNKQPPPKQQKNPFKSKYSKGIYKENQQNSEETVLFYK